MKLKEQDYSMLVVSCSKSFNAVISEICPSTPHRFVHFASNVNEAKRCLTIRDFDFIIVNSPLPDDVGVDFAIDSCQTKSTVTLILARPEVFPDVRAEVEHLGVLTLQKPTSRQILEQALSWMASFRERLRKLMKKSLSFEQRMEEIKVINRAKLHLISEYRMSEDDAHRSIERHAMDLCITKLEAARLIIENKYIPK